MRYVHVEDDPVRAAADAVAERRRGLVGLNFAPEATPARQVAAPPIVAPPRSIAPSSAEPVLGLDDRAYASRTKLGNYRPYRKRSGPNRAAPPKGETVRDEEVEHV